MATIKILYRSKKEEAKLTIRLVFTRNGSIQQIEAKTEELVTRYFWETDYNKKRINNIHKFNFVSELKAKIEALSKHVLNQFHRNDINAIDKTWLVNSVKHFYNPDAPIELTEYLTNFFDFYIEKRKNELTEHRKNRIRTIKKRIEQLEILYRRKIELIDVNEEFKGLYMQQGEEQYYQLSTVKIELSTIQTICTYAQYLGLKTHPQLIGLRKIKLEETDSPYLTFEELEKIKNLNLSDEPELDNARNWLIISCYTGQRISDFMRFNLSMLLTQNGKSALMFTQQKTRKKIVIPFLKEAKDVFDQLGGNFPNPIHHQTYNALIKDVCKLANINEMTEGFVSVVIDGKARRSLQEVPKYKLVTSHIGRRSFATNYYTKIPTSVLIGITGHSSEKMFLKYIKKTDYQKAFDAFEHFDKL